MHGSKLEYELDIKFEERNHGEKRNIVNFVLTNCLGDQQAGSPDLIYTYGLGQSEKNVVKDSSKSYLPLEVAH